MLRFVSSGLVLALALSSVACAPPPPPRRATAHTTSATMEPPVKKEATAAIDIETMLKRETTVPLKDFRVRAADGALEMHVKAVAAPMVKSHKRDNGSSYTVATFSIGSETDVVCSASSTPLDIAHWAEDIVKSIHVQLGAPPAVRVEAIESRPLMFIDTDGAITDPKDGVPKRNIAKFAGVHFDGGSITCVHDGVGYRDTFHDLMTHVSTKTLSPNAPRPTYRDVTTLYEGETVMGFSYHQRWEGEKKGEWHESQLGSAILHTERSWAAADSGWHGVIDAKGVVSERAMKRLGAMVWLDMKLDRKSPTSYSFEGTVEGTPKQGTFTTKAPLVTHLSRAPMIAAFLKDPKKKEISFFHFDESEPDKGAIKETAKRSGANTLRMEENGKAYDVTVNASGVITRSQRPDTNHWWEQTATAGSL